MAQLMHANAQWANRPADQRFTSIHELHSYLVQLREQSRGTVVSSRKLQVAPSCSLPGGDPRDMSGLAVSGPNGHAYSPTHWAFGQLCARVGADASYLRTLPAPLVSDCLNFGYQVARGPEDVGVLLRKNGANTLADVEAGKLLQTA